MKIKYRYDNATENAIRKLEAVLNKLKSIQPTYKLVPSVTEDIIHNTRYYSKSYKSTPTITVEKEVIDKLATIKKNAIPISLEIEWEEGDDEIKSLYEDK